MLVVILSSEFQNFVHVVVSLPVIPARWEVSASRMMLPSLVLIDYVNIGTNGHIYQKVVQ